MYFTFIKIDNKIITRKIRNESISFSTNTGWYLWSNTPTMWIIY